MEGPSEPSAIRELLHNKLSNFKQLYYHRACKIGAKEELEDVDVDQLIGAFIGIKLFWGFIEEKDEQTLLMLVASAGEDVSDGKFEQRNAFLELWKSSLPADREVFWRYVKFFLHCVKHLTATTQ